MSETSDFFVTGGTLRPTDPSYVTRPADEALLRHLQAGEFCYVLTPRQMGKSSLMVRTAQRLRAAGTAVVIIDLTRIGSGALAVDQWYLGLLSGLRSGLRLPVEVEAWWQAHAALGVAQRFTTFLHDVVLAEASQPVVILIDEIDATLNLPFRDDFFAALRAVYNERAGDPRYNRLTFGLLGVATPTDLIQDRERTPFNIGQRIDLVEFTLADAAPLHSGLAAHYPEEADALLQQIFTWTKGHPYLTQKLCQALVDERGTAAFDPLLTSPSLGEEPSRRDEKTARSSSLGEEPPRLDETTVLSSSLGEEPSRRDEKTAPSPNWGGLGRGSERGAEDWVAALVQKLFLSDEGRKDSNLTFIQDRIAGSPPHEQRQLLQLYRRVQRGDAVPDDDRSPVQNRLELYGLVGVQQGRVQVRNPIYAQVFNDAWIAAAMPVNPQRRLAALAVLTTFLLTIGIFAWINFRQPTACTVYEQQFTGNQESTLRLDALYRLLLAQDRCGTLALDLFYRVPPAEHEQLFLGITDLPAARTQLTAVIQGIYGTLDTTPAHDLALLDIWRTVLQNAGVAENDPLLVTIRHWREGRTLLAESDAAGAVTALATALVPNHPVLYYDYALALAATGEYTAALVALDSVVQMSGVTPLPAAAQPGASPLTTTLGITVTPLSLLPTPTPLPTPTEVVILPLPGLLDTRLAELAAATLTARPLIRATSPLPTPTPAPMLAGMDEPYLRRFGTSDQVINRVRAALMADLRLSSAFLQAPSRPPTLAQLPQLTAIPLQSQLQISTTLTMTFVYVPAGAFMMGSPAGEGNDDEHPQHEVTVDAYWIGQTEVTNAEYRAFIEAGGYTERQWWTAAGWQWREENKLDEPYYWQNEQWNQPAYPVVGVSWYEAVAYTRWLSATTGLTIRLPTEAEWERAARGDDGRIYPWGNEWMNGRANILGTEDGYEYTAPVGSYPEGAGPYGALDMTGNVWEWTVTKWLENYEDYATLVDNNLDADGSARRVVRGGAWVYSQDNVRAAYRRRFAPDYRDDTLGFRVVVSVAPQKAFVF